MVVIRFMGGLGNQMFQYALYKTFEKAGRQVRADMTFFAESRVPYQLENLYGLHVEKAERADIERYRDNSRSLLSRIRRKVFGKKKSDVSENIEIYYEFNDKDNMYLNGYWQNSKYFESVVNDLRESFVLREPMTEYQQKVISKMENVLAASIHIRRGDYLSGDNVKMYGNICTDDYYESAINYLEQRCGVKDFFVFSDDVKWAQERFKSINGRAFHVVRNTDDRDMFLMATCKHNIIANSSYSWWAAWLNMDKDKVVIAPSVWLNTSDVRGIYCDEWVLISPNGHICEGSEAKAEE